MRTITLYFFKESGKYYTEETMEVDSQLHTYQIVDHVNEHIAKYKGMHILIMFSEDDPIGFPCLILSKDRIAK